MLERLLQGLENRIVHCPNGYDIKEIEISSVTADSRVVEKGVLFVAIVGGSFDGHNFIDQSVEGGCNAVVVNRGGVPQSKLQALLEAHVAVIELPDTTKGYAIIAANYHNNPAEDLILAGVTGTNGKTTVTYLVEQVLQQLGVAVGVVGTVNNRYYTSDGKKRVLDTSFTTPEPLTLQSVLREMVDNGVTHVIMEVSSHALIQARVNTLLFKVGAFTNFSRDHLDFHHNMESYFEAKSKLFTDYLQEDGIVVLPQAHTSSDQLSDPWVWQLQLLCKRLGHDLILWGEQDNADIQLISCKKSLEETEIVIQFKDYQCTVQSPLVGDYNIENIMTAFGICAGFGFEHADIGRLLSFAGGAPGRVQKVSLGKTWPTDGPAVLVDYAHTPDALEKVLTTVNELPHSKLFTVFGCGGDRDTGKRPLMGEIAARISDIAIVTDDNPRTENPDTIIDDILVGVRRQEVSVFDEAWLLQRAPAESGCVVVRDRRRAIELAIKSAGPDDIVVVAGKGHEPYQLTAEGKRYFDDVQQAQNACFCWSPSLVAEATGGQLLVESDSRSGELLGQIVTDSREVTEKGVFVALKGDNHDAHTYVGQAVANGCKCLVVERKVDLPVEHVFQVLVQHTTRALGDLAAFRKRRLSALTKPDPPLVIGLTGSCGKTTVKEMVAAILNCRWPAGPDYPENAVLKTKGNFNNLIGLPLSLLPINFEQKVAVLEMGMNRRKEIERLCEIADPDVSCITNIHGAHLEGLGSIEGVAKAKEELFATTRKDAILIVNLDDLRITRLSEKYTQKKITYGLNKVAEDGPKLLATNRGGVCQPDIFATDIEINSGTSTGFNLHYGDRTNWVNLNIVGEHNVSNALCATAIAVAVGIDIDTIAEGLETFRAPDKRMAIIPAAAGFDIINDCYNANPASMAAGLTTLVSVADGKTVAVLGDMLELGAASETSHFEIGKLVADLNLDRVAVVGKFGANVLAGALANGFSENRIAVLEDKGLVVPWLKAMVTNNQLGKGDMLLIKASRGLHFETIVDQLL